MTSRRRPTRALFLSLSLLASALTLTAAQARECDADLSSTHAKLATADCLAVDAKAEGIKKEGLPRKLAVGSFHVRFNARAQKADWAVPGSVESNRLHLEWDDDFYQTLTDRMYDRFVERMTDEGFALVDLETIKETKSYGKLKDNVSRRANGRVVRFAPYGMKLFEYQGMSPGHRQLPGIGSELGADATVSVFVEVSLCGYDKGGIFRKKRPATLCIGEVDGSKLFRGATFLVWFYGAPHEWDIPLRKAFYTAGWTNGFRKFAKPSIAVDNELAIPVGLWNDSSRTGDEVVAFADGTLGLFDLLLDLGVTRYKSQSSAD